MGVHPFVTTLTIFRLGVVRAVVRGTDVGTPFFNYVNYIQTGHLPGL